MEKKLEIIMERLKDERGKKVVFVSHCILNQNTRYLGGAFRKGSVDEFLDELQSKGIGICQMVCPERKAWGGVLKRDMLRAFGAKGTLPYRLRSVYLPFWHWRVRRALRKIAREAAEEIKDYKNSGFEVIGIVGVAGSPTCGVNKTMDTAKSLEFISGIDVNSLNRKNFNSNLERITTEGEGEFIRLLKDELKKRNIEVKFDEIEITPKVKGR
nr:2-thiouracil desulfurase family protein [Candidatus Freyarchaeota archaeon]